MRSKQRTKDKIGPLKNNTGDIVDDDVDAANVLNNYFSSVFTIENCLYTIILLIFNGEMKKEGLLKIKISSNLVEKKLKLLKG